MSATSDPGIVVADSVARALMVDRPSGETRYVSDYDDGELHGATLVPGLMYQYQLRDARFGGGSSISLTIYLRVGKLGEALWAQETRALHRIGGMRHLGLPELIESGVQVDSADERGTAFVLTRAYHSFLDDSTRPARRLRSSPSRALTHLWTLADALSVMHSSQLTHRALWPGALASDGTSLRITRFEMSGMLANLLLARRDDAMTAQSVRDYYLGLPERSRVFAPPERLDFLFGTTSTGLGGMPGDVFSLGMIAAEWLLGPETLDGPAGTRDEVAAIHERVRSALNIDATLPAAVSAGILEMLSVLPANRSTASAAAGVLGAAYDRMAALEGDFEIETRPHVVGFLPKYVDRTIREWKYTQLPATTPEGRDEVARFIQEDMRGARVVWSPSGAVNHVRGDLAKLRSARTVIVGNEIVWFCNDGFLEDGAFGREDFPAIQTILFVREATPSLVRRILEGSLYRQLHSVEVVSFSDPYEALVRAGRTGASWAPLLDSTRVAVQLPEAAQLRIDALRWYLEYRRALQAGREYAYEIRDGGSLTRPWLHWDRHTDQEVRGRAERGLPRLVVRDPSRPTMVDFLGAAEDDQGSLKVELFRRPDHGTGRGDPVGEFELDDIIGSEIVVLRNNRGEKIDAKGWLRLVGDRGDEPQLVRQSRATEELAERVDLLNLLVDPRGSRMSLDRWTDAGIALEGTGPARVVDILEHEPIFVLQGPPGTGKTELTSEAVAAFLQREQGARVLVSAQSHDALDNLALRILRKLGMTSADRRTADYTALRVASSATMGSVAPTMTEWTEDAAVERALTGLKTHAREWIRQVETPEEHALVPYLERWLAGIERLDLDLRVRIRRGANLVFATTGQSTRENLVDRGAQEPFDWVIVEEAGRTWPTELALPLVRGNRWTLIGDHAQIGPYALNDVRRFIASLAGDDDEELSGIAKNIEPYMAAFDTFGTMMRIEGDDRPRGVLTEQYRMTSQIATVVSRAFYKDSGGLATPRPDRDHGMIEPPWVVGRSLVWIDTENAQASRGFWENELEAEVVSDIVRAFHPRMTKSSSLAILTPYRKQVSLLRQRLSEHATQIHTVDSYQGLEADIVIASLVRDRDVDPDRPEYAHVGHLADPGRTNVLLSRARRLLIVVGRYSVYDRFGGDPWREVASAFADPENARIVPLSRWQRR